MEIENLEKKIASTLMSKTGPIVSESHQSFSSWLLGGLSAAYAYILANLSDVLQHVSVSAVKWAIVAYVFSLLLVVVQRLIASSISAAEKGREVGEEIDAFVAENKLTVDHEALFKEFEKASYYPAKWLIKIQFSKLLKGDITVNGRQQLKLAQIQGFFMIAQTVFSVVSILILVCGVNA